MDRVIFLYGSLAQVPLRTCMAVIFAGLREGGNVNFSGSMDSMQYLGFLN